MMATELTDDFERKRHYQTLKKDLFIAALQALPDKGEDQAEELAKKMYRSITEERWGSEPVETPRDTSALDH